MRFAIVLDQLGARDPPCRGPVGSIDRNGLVRRAMNEQGRDCAGREAFPKIRFPKASRKPAWLRGSPMERIKVQSRTASLTGLLT